MRKYVACASVAAAAALIAIPVAGAQARQSQHGAQAKQGFIVVGRHNARVSLFVQRNHASTRAHAASCLAGMLSPPYCSAPIEQNLFGAYAWGVGSATFGSNNSTTCRALGYPSTARTCGVYTTDPNTLIAVFVGAGGAGQSVTVSCKTSSGGTCPVTFHKVKSENAAGDDSEVWYADATNPISQSAPIFVTATDADADCGFFQRSSCDVSLQAITFKNAITAGATGVQATGIGASNACYSNSGTPSCSLTTTEPDSVVWGALDNPSSATIPTWPSNQFAIGVADGNSRKTFYSQFLGTCTANANGTKPCTTMPLPTSGLYQNPFQLAPTSVPALGTNVTINDTAPKTPFNEVVVEIL